MPDDEGPRTQAELRAIYRQPGQASIDKEVDHFDVHCRAFIAHAPFLVLATTDGAGRVDTSPKGGPPGFVSVLDDTRLAIPDMSGNNRIDSLGNIVRCPAVSVLFMVPRFGETLRVVGKATLSTAPEVLRRCSLDDLVPNVAIVVEMTTAYLHCAKALRRSGLWETERWPEISGLPSPACIFRDHMKLEGTTEEMQEDLDEAYASTTWAMGGSAPSAR